jgi:hypothetical protein
MKSINDWFYLRVMIKSKKRKLVISSSVKSSLFSLLGALVSNVQLFQIRICSMTVLCNHIGLHN